MVEESGAEEQAGPAEEEEDIVELENLMRANFQLVVDEVDSENSENSENSEEGGESGSSP